MGGIKSAFLLMDIIKYVHIATQFPGNMLGYEVKNLAGQQHLTAGNPTLAQMQWHPTFTAL